MIRLSGEFQTDLPMHEAVVACTEAIEGLGWHIEDVESNRIVSRANTGSQHPPKIEVVLSESEGATGVRITGTDTFGEPHSQDALIAELDRVRDAINASLEGAKAAPKRRPPAGWYPDPADAGKGRHAGYRYWDGVAWTGRTSPSPPGPEAQAAARDGGDRRVAPTGRKRMATAGIVAGLVAIGLGIVGIAILTDSSEDAGRERGNESPSKAETSQPEASRTGTSQRKERERSADASGGSPNQGQTPAASGQSDSDLGVTKRVRDGDERFELTPKRVGREGSFITLDIKVTGLGNPGFDTPTHEFLGTLIGSNGRPYSVENSAGPADCEFPTVKLTKGRTLNGCLPFRVPEGIEAERFQYQPFFVGGDSVKWDLS